MEYIDLGPSDIRVSRLGFGGCPVGGHGWGGAYVDSRAAIHRALDNGVTFFDTADIYGLGRSEAVLGEALSGMRHKLVLATKFGVRRVCGRTVYDNRPEYIRKALKESLLRLNTTYVDLYQLHYWDEKTPLGEIQATIGSLIDAGLIRAWGVTNLDPLDLDPASGPMPVSYSYQHNLVTPHPHAHLDRIQRELGASFLSWGSLAQGALSGKYPDHHRFDDDDRRARDVYSAFHGAGLTKRTAMLSAIRTVQERHPAHTLAQIAVRWILQARPESVPLVGIKTPGQIDEMTGTFGWSLDEADMERLSTLATRPVETFATQRVAAGAA